MVNEPSAQPNTSLPEAIRFGPVLWALIVVMGVGIGLSAAGLMDLLHFTQHAIWHYERGTFLHAVTISSGWYRVVVLVVAGMAGGAALWFILRSCGWRSIEVNPRIWRRPQKLPVIQSIAAAALTMILVGAGESLGRERSAKQAGGLIGSKIAELAGLNGAEWRYLTALGSATGMGAVYNMPVGGALFGLEVLLGNLSLPLVLPALVLGGIATLAAWLVIPQHPTYLVPRYHLVIGQVLWAVAAGPVFGAVSGLYVRLLTAAGAYRARKNALLFAPIAAFGVLGALAIPYPELLGNGKDVVQLAFTGSLSVGVAAALVLLKPAAVAICVWSGLPGGLFTPTLTLGALTGTVLGALWSTFWPGAPLGSYALIGGGAMIAAATQGPISAIVMLAELTGVLTPFLVPLAIASAIAAALSRRLVPRSIYSGP